MTIFGFAKYLALRLIEQPSRADGAKPYAPNAGNIFFALFAAVGMVGAVGYGFNSVLRGPISAMTETTKRTVAESTVITSSRLAIVGATTQQTDAGDTDNDGFIEPVPYRDAATAPHPAGGGFLPTALNIPNTIDPWNTEYGYCAWDHGSVTVSSRRLVGSPNNNRHAIAIISAGKDKRFQTSCVAYVDDTTNLIQRTAGSDDIVLAYTYAEANDLGNGLWKPHASVANTATTDRNIDVTGGGLVSGGVVLSGNTATGGGLILPSDPGDDSISGACDAMNDNQLRYNISDPAEPPVIEICDNGGLGWSPVSGGAGGGGGGGVMTGQMVAHYKFDESTGTTAADDTGLHDGTLYNNPTWSPGQGRIGGALRFTAASNTYVRVPRTAALEPTAVTVSLWARRSGAQDAWAGLMTKTYSNNGAPTHHSYGLYFNDASDDTIFTHKGYAGSNNSVLSTAAFMQDTVWYHIVMVLDPAGAAPQERLYINGVLNNSDTDTNPIAYDSTSTGDLYIGTTQGAIGEKFNGYIDDVRIYNYGMTTEEVTSLYNSVNTTSLNLDGPQKAGAIYSWGSDVDGRLGNGTAETTPRHSPGPSEASADFIQISGGQRHACGVKANGTAWCWGWASPGSMGNGTTTPDPSTPVQVSNLTNIIKVSAGAYHSCAIRNDGAVFCWGTNTDGMLGDGTTTQRTTPVQVLGLANAIDIATGVNRTCAVVADGGAWCWGYGVNGELGNGGTSTSYLPVQVSNVTDFVQIAMGLGGAGDPTCGVTKRGKAYCWGADTSQQLGNGAGAAYASTPSEVLNISENFSKISVNHSTVCAIVATANNAVACWGAGSNGEIGHGSAPASVHTPTFVSHITGIVDVAVTTHSVCAVEVTGNVWCWGLDNSSWGGLGNGEATSSGSYTPVLAKASNAYKISAGMDFFLALVDTSALASAPPPQYAKKFASGHVGDAQHTCHIRSDGTMWCWGVEQFGELGNGGGSTETATTPVRVTDPGPWMSVSAGHDHTCGIKVDGSAWCWGGDASGQLGDGATAGPQVNPVQITSTIPWAQIAAGRDSTCGIKSDGTLFCWGSDASGRLGNGAGGNTNAPGTAITSTLPWIQVSTGEGTCGIKSDNSLWCWGMADNGRLGNGTITPNLETPARTGTDSWRYIDETGPCGIKTDGSLWCWGWNTNQKMGIGTTYTGDQSVPRLVVEPGPWASVKGAFFGTACGVKMDGTGWCWGDAADSMGTGGTTPGADVPYPIPVLGKDWVDIEGGADYFKCGIKKDDSVWCWGNDFFDILGNGTGASNSNYPQRIYNPYKSSFTAADATTSSYAATPAANLAIGTTVPLTNIEGTVQGITFPGSGRTLLRQATTANQFMLETAPVGGAAQIWLTANRYPYYMGYSAYTGGLEFGYGSDWLTNYTGASLEVSNEGFTGIGTGGAPVAKLDVRGGIRAGDAGATCNAGVAGTLKYATEAVTYCNGSNWVEFGLPSATTVGMLWETSKYSADPGIDHTCGITAEGSLWCWGSGANDRLGTGSTTQQNVPAAVSIIGKFLQVTTGQEGGCALRSDHTVWCWGTDTNGMLGNDGVDAASAVPVQVSSALGWVQISGYYSFTCGIKTDGTGWCWGRGTDGQRGDSTNNNNAYVPVQISGAGAWSKLSVGRTHACGIKTDATLWCWGENLYGQLGHGGTINTNAPVQVGVGQWVDIAVARWHSCGIMVDGTARCWGRNSYYEIGDNTNTQRNSPTALTGTGTGTWKSIAAAEGVSCGIKSVGTAWCWGAGSSGQRGDGTTTATLGQAVQVTAGGGWSNIYAGNEHVCATRPNSRLYCWGQALNGKLGNGTTTPNVLNPWLMP